MRLSSQQDELQYLLISHNRAVDAKIEPHFPSGSIHRPAGGPVEDGELGIPRVPVLLVHAPPQLSPFMGHGLAPAHMDRDWRQILLSLWIRIQEGRGGQNEDGLPSTSISTFETTCRRHHLPLKKG
jgi:hypothetical protein